MTNVGNNYGKVNLCPLGCIARDNQEHIFQCKELLSDITVSESFKYSDIFSADQTKFTYAANLADKLIRKREKMITV